MKANSYVTNAKATAYSPGQTAENIPGNGKMVSSTEKVLSFLQMDRVGEDCGKTGRRLSGLMKKFNFDQFICFISNRL